MRKYLSIFIERSVLVGAALLALAASANAQYGIAAEINDSGGGASANAAYTNNGSIGTIGGTATASSPVEFVKSGFVGELYNVAGLQVTAPATSVDGGLEFQLGATELMDDGSYLPANPGSVSWSVVTGPISGLSSAGVATAGMVSQNTAATVDGSLAGFTGGLGLTVVPLAISTQDSQQSAVLGQPFTFTISAVSGEGPFTYQWLFNGSDIAGATGSSYSISSASSGNAGNYTVQVSNSLGSYLTSAFDLTVNSGVPAATRWTLIALTLLLFAGAARRLPKAGGR
jgi:hypothetical protein